MILLFASQANGTATAKSDIDLCIVASTSNKRTLLTDLYFDTESDIPIDFLLYTPEEWDRCVNDHQSFVHKLNRERAASIGDSLRYKDWYEKAMHDLYGAKILMEHDATTIWLRSTVSRQWKKP